MNTRIKCSLPEYLSTRTRWEGDCLLWNNCLNTSGYGWVCGKFATEYGTQLVHRITWIYYNGSIPKGLLVLHSCDVRNCINLAHLRLGSDADNAMDRATRSRGGDFRGEKSYKAKLTWDKVAFIRRTKGIFSGALLARVFDVSCVLISAVRLNKIWVGG